MAADAQAPAVSRAAVLLASEPVPSELRGQPVRGYDFNRGSGDLAAVLRACASTGFQATNFALAADQINAMLRWRLADEPVAADEVEELRDAATRAATRCTVFLGFTSNMVSCGVRDVLRYLAQHRLVDVMVTTGGAVEEDIMKCFNPHLIGDFKLAGRPLRKMGINRLGNLLVPNKNYCDLENWIMPILDSMLHEQRTQGTSWTPSKVIRRFGEAIDNPESIWYWCAKNDIPVFCPALTDGSVGDMIYFHSYRNPGLKLDIVEDIRALNDIAVNAHKTGMVVLGGGLVKHHVCNANLMRNGADFSVFINTAMEYDGSDSGASPDEAISWGKIRMDAQPVKVVGDASLLFPLLVAQTFAPYHERSRGAAAEAAAAAADAGAAAAAGEGSESTARIQ